MKSFAKILLKTLKLFTLSVLVFVVILDIAAEAGLLTSVIAPWLERKGSTPSVYLKTKTIRCGIFTGFRAKTVTLIEKGRRARRLATFNELRLTPDYRALLTGRKALLSGNFTDGSIPLYTSINGKTPSPAGMLDGVRADFRIAPGALAVSELKFQCNGIPFRFQGHIGDIPWKHWIMSGKSLAGENAPASPRPLWDRLNGEQQDKVSGWLNTVASHQYSGNTGEVTGHFDIPLQRPRNIYVEASFLLADVMCGNYVLDLSKGQLMFKDQRLHYRNMFVKTAGGAVFRANGHLSPSTGNFQANVRGEMDPEFFRQFPFPKKVKSYVTRFSRGGGVTFDAAVTSARYWHGKWKLDASITAEQLQYGAVRIRELGVDLSYADTMVSLENLRTQLRAGEKELSAEGNLRYSLPGGHMQGRLHARGDLSILCRQTSLIPQAVTRVFSRSEGKTPSMTARFDHLQLSPGTAPVQGNFDLAMRHLRVNRLHINKATAACTLSENKLHLKDIAITPFEKADEAEIPNSAHVNGSISLNPHTDMVKGGCEGAVAVEQLSQLLPEQPDRASVLGRISDGRVHFRCDFERSSSSPTDWQINAQVTSGRLTVENRTFRKVAASADIDRNGMTLTVDHAETTEGTSLAGTITHAWSSGRLQAEGTFRVPPQHLTVLFPPGQKRQDYERIWKHFSWPGGEVPRFIVKQARAENMGQNNLRIHSDVEFSNRKMSYRGVHLEEVAGNLSGRVPGKIHLRDLEATHRGFPLQGDLIFHTRGQGGVKIDLTGKMNPWTVLSAMNADWQKYRDIYQFSDNSDLAVKGFIPFLPGHPPRLHGRLRTHRLTAFQVPFHNVEASWDWTDTRLKIRYLTAELADGEAKLTGVYNFMPQAGNFNAICNNVKLEKFVELRESWRNLKTIGELNGNTEFSIDYGGTKHPKIVGDGHLTLRKSNLWRMPLLTQLGQLLRASLIRKIAGLGNITELDADFFLEGDHVRVPRFETNGTIVSLRGNGEYRWPSAENDFRIQGVLLKKTGIIPWLTHALSWAFEVTLEGNLHDPKYRLVSAIRRQFSDDGKDLEK